MGINWRWVLGGSVATLAGLKRYSDRAVRRARAKHPPIGRFVEVDGVRLHYVAKGSGRPVVFLHAGGLVLQDFTLSLYDRVAASHRAIVFDRPGYGYSERPAGEPLSLALHARLIHGAVQQLGVEEPILVGHSHGGSVALRYALDFPDDVAGLVLLAPDGFAGGVSFPSLFYIPNLPVLGTPFLQTLAVPLWQAMTPLFIAGLFAPAAPPDGYVATMRGFTIRPDQFRAYAEELTRLRADLRGQSARYGTLRAPVVLMVGTADRVAPLEAQARPLQGALPQARLVVLEDTGHALHHQHPEAVMEAIQDVSRQRVEVE